MRYIEAPEHYDGDGKSLFLAGGIRNCPDWQSYLADLLKETDLVILNPRRKVFPIHEPNIVEKQITWEYNHLERANVVSFWFPKEAINTLTLYELGAWSKTDKIIFVEVHPEYPKKMDIEIQIKLARPDVDIVYNLESLSEQIIEWIDK